MQSQTSSGKKTGNPSSAADQADTGKVQGEGDYESNRRYTQSVKNFVESGKVEAAARDAKPQSPLEAAGLLEAERAGASHAKGSEPSSDRKRT